MVFYIPNFIPITVVPQKTITFYIPIFTLIKLKVMKFLCSFNMYLCACRHVVLSYYNVNVVVVTEPERPLILVSMNNPQNSHKNYQVFLYFLPLKLFHLQTIFLS